MHTFFINTSKKILDDYKVLFDVYYENRTLVPINCELDKWYDEAQGSSLCVKKMCEMVDNYAELGNDFNLVIYTDLTEVETYAKIERDRFEEDERVACAKALKLMISNMIGRSLVNKLVTSGLEPRETLLMFGVDKRFGDYEENNTEIFNKKVQTYLFDFLGLPTEENAKEISFVKIEELAQKLKGYEREELVPQIRSDFLAELDMWYENIRGGMTVSDANEHFYGKMLSELASYNHTLNMHTLNCSSDYKAEEANRRLCALGRMNLALHLIKCVESARVCSDNGEPMPFVEYTAKELAGVLKAKRRNYEKKRTEILSLSDSPAKLKLAPELFAFDSEKFGMDEFGAPREEIKLVDVDGERSDDEALRDKKKALVSERSGAQTLITRDINLFTDIPDDDGYGEDAKALTPDEYIKKAKETKKKHVDYLKRLKEYVSNVMSNYSGRDEENRPPVLKKRRVSVTAEPSRAETDEYNYAIPSAAGDGSFAKETRRIKVVKDASNAAYDTATVEYLDFVSTRSVSISDIDEQCDWFVTKVEGIRESLKRVSLITVGLSLMLILLYVPFVILQWERIISSLDSCLVALVSLAAPLAVLYLALLMVVLAQKKKYKEAWEEFKKKNEAAISANEAATRDFYKYLTSVVPALRWVYEYKLDVGFYDECCRMARAKLDYHERKIDGILQSIKNILNDLDEGMSESHSVLDEKYLSTKVDYNSAISVGENNVKFYTVADYDFLEALEADRNSNK